MSETARDGGRPDTEGPDMRSAWHVGGAPAVRLRGRPPSQARSCRTPCPSVRVRAPVSLSAHNLHRAAIGSVGPPSGEAAIS